jgi:hypothetical protein
MHALEECTAFIFGIEMLLPWRRPLSYTHIVWDFSLLCRGRQSVSGLLYTVINDKTRICGCYGDECEDVCLLLCCAVYKVWGRACRGKVRPFCCLVALRTRDVGVSRMRAMRRCYSASQVSICFGGSYSRLRQGGCKSFETSNNIYQTTRRNITQDNHL